MERAAGILMSISSLPSPYGIGTLGKAAYDFADFLHESGQKYWQMLPLGPTGYGDSPYQSFSSFAGNPYFIDLDMLIEDKLLKKSDLKGIDFGKDPEHVDYGKIYEARFPLLELAKDRGWERDREEVAEFVAENRWIPDYTLYMACKKHFKMQPWTEWKDKKLRFREPETLEKYRHELADDVEFYTYIQFLFYKQWKKLRAYLKKKEIMTIGDIPIYVPLDSADVWSEPQFFQLDENYMPDKVAGVPPDYFSADGQLWGNPLYDYNKMQSDGFGWWIRRIDGATKLYDMIRIDHFRGFSEYWAVPYGDKTAKNGKWMQGPGMNLIGPVAGWFRGVSFIAEDLGTPTESLRQLLKDSGWPGMKVLEFAFDSSEESSFLPHGYDHNCICYTGTHDNAPLVEWLENAKSEDVLYACDYLGVEAPEYDAGGKTAAAKASVAASKAISKAAAEKAGVPSVSAKPAAKAAGKKAPAKLFLTEKNKKDFVWGVIRDGQKSVADLFIVQMQDYLELGEGNRMNTPSIASGNWSWRMRSDAVTKELTEKISHITKLYGRYPQSPEEKKENE